MIEVEQTLNIYATNTHRCPNLFWVLTTTFLCKQVVLEHTVERQSYEHFLNSTVLQKVVSPRTWQEKAN